jgi:hypothetical protein
MTGPLVVRALKLVVRRMHPAILIGSLGMLTPEAVVPETPSASVRP